MSISLVSFRSFKRFFLNFLPNKSVWPLVNSALSSSKSRHSGASLARRPLRRSEVAQKDAFPTREMARLSMSMTVTGGSSQCATSALRAKPKVDKEGLKSQAHGRQGLVGAGPSKD